MGDERAAAPLWSWCAALAFALLAFALHGHFGLTWDEGVQAEYGELALAYYSSGFQDVRYLDFLDLRHYGALFEALSAMTYDAESFGKFARRHLLTAVFASLAIPALAGFCRGTGVRGFGALAALALFVQPRFFGHAFGNSKDIPFAVAVVWFLWAATVLWAALVRGRAGGREVLACGAAAGLALALRPGGLLVVGALFVMVAALAVWFADDALSQLRQRSTLGAVFAVSVIAWLVLVASWPLAHRSPLLEPVRAVTRSTQFEGVYAVRFGGEVLPSNEVPATYLLHWLLVVTPLPVLALALLGLGRLAKRLFNDRSRKPELLVPTAASLWLLLPLGAFVVLRPNVYDGLRHFLFVLPAVAVLAAYGGVGLQRLLERQVPRVSWLAVVALLLMPVGSLLALHPYQYVYFNSAVGGVAGASGRYDTDYWAASYGEALDWVARRVENAPAGRQWVTVLDSTSYLSPLARHYRRPHHVVLTADQYADVRDRLPVVDFWIVGNRAGWGTLFPEADSLHVVERQGAVLASVLRPTGAKP
ncbi:MAG: hypothetical protein AAF690_07085 [Acidobacteriota bacterium]